MSDPPNKYKVYVDKLFDAVKQRGEELASEGGIPGTKVSVWDLMSARGALKEFEESCPVRLAKGDNCVGDFNLLGGKKLKLDIAPMNGAQIIIESATGSQRRMTVKPEI